MNHATHMQQATLREELPGHFDGWLIALVVCLVAIGAVMIASSSIGGAIDEKLRPLHYLIQHSMHLSLGLVLIGIAVKTPIHFLQRYSFWFLALSFVLLCLVFVPGVGARINNATRWIKLAGFTFQVVEAVKLLLILYISGYLVRHWRQVRTSIMGIIKPLLCTAAMVLLLMLQPDFGSACILIVIVVGMLWMAGLRFRDLLVLLLATVPALYHIAYSVKYRNDRMTMFWNPFLDADDKGFQLVQALVATGRGEWFGVGLGASVQKLMFLPMAHSDFIVAVIAEEAGFIGVVVLAALFSCLCIRIMQLGLRASRCGMAFASHCCYGIAIWIMSQVIINIGVNLGALPTKGLTLPLISAGGSSIMMTLAAIGVVLRISYEVSQQEARLGKDGNENIDQAVEA